MIDVRRRLSAPPEGVWSALTDTSVWSEWGPSVAGATLDDGTTVIGPDTTGRVHTSLGVSLPFAVTDWQPGRLWAWKVAGVPATSHGVEPAGDGTMATIGVPLWAPVYAPLCWVALGRLGAVADRLS